jgi:hypothetical protein
VNPALASTSPLAWARGSERRETTPGVFTSSGLEPTCRACDKDRHGLVAGPAGPARGAVGGWGTGAEHSRLLCADPAPQGAVCLPMFFLDWIYNVLASLGECCPCVGVRGRFRRL